MNKQQTILINGATYDAHTGMRISDAPATHESSSTAAHARKSVTAHSLHAAKTKHSQTLSRRHVAVPAHKAHTLRKKPTVVHGAKSPLVHKFAPATVNPARSQTPTVMDIGPTPHPKVVAHSTSKVAVHHKTTHHASNQQIKNHAIQTAMEHATTKKTHTPAPKHGKRLLHIATASVALVLFVGYLTYINMPSLSVKIASAQAGIAASYPSYQPAGYTLAGPVAFNDGQVTMRFNATSNPQSFTLNQSRSTWDSSALLDNYVEQASGGQYETFQDSGLTIYTYGTDAAWVNGGILHTINGDATLSNDQVRHIATSM